MSTIAQIISSCLICNGRIYRDGELLFSREDPGVPFLDEIYRRFEINYPRFFKMDGLSQLGFLASEILLGGHQERQRYQPYETAVVLQNANSSLDTDLKYLKSTQELASPALFVYTLPNIVIGEICIRNQFKGENAFFVFRSFDPTFMTQYVNHLFEGATKSCLCGWVEFLGAAYKTALFLVEQGEQRRGNTFTAENMEKIYKLENG